MIEKMTNTHRSGSLLILAHPGAIGLMEAVLGVQGEHS
jgi:hypothetical protein